MIIVQAAHHRLITVTIDRIENGPEGMPEDFIKHCERQRAIVRRHAAKPADWAWLQPLSEAIRIAGGPWHPDASDMVLRLAASANETAWARRVLLPMLLAKEPAAPRPGAAGGNGLVPRARRSTKATALHRLVGETLVREGPAAQKVALVLRQVGVGYAHGSSYRTEKNSKSTRPSFIPTRKAASSDREARDAFEVTDEGGKPWALKVLSEANPTTTRRNRFANEQWFCAHTLIQIGCPCGMGPQRSGHTVLCDAATREIVDRLRTGIADEKILTDLRQMLDGIEAAHANKVWHRDLKPENVLYDAERDALVVADFGIAHFRSDICGPACKRGRATGWRIETTPRPSNVAKRQRSMGGRIFMRSG